MVELLLVALLLAALAAPHAMPLRAASAGVASAVWLGALALRALIVSGTALFVLVYLPQTELFRVIAERCLHAAVPILATHLGLSGHRLADAALILPVVVITTSLLWVGFGLVRAALALHARLVGQRLGAGPHGSTVIEEPGVILAVTGFGRTRVLISREALTTLDHDELEASLAHEWGHVRRRHRPLLVLASLLGGVARWLPGTRTAAREFRLSLERDADAFAVRATNDPLALASAICKAAPAAKSFGAGVAAVAPLGGGGSLAARLDPLLGETRRSRRLDNAARLLAIVLATLTLGLVSTVPAVALSGPPASITAVDCGH